MMQSDNAHSASAVGVAALDFFFNNKDVRRRRERSESPYQQYGQSVLEDEENSDMSDSEAAGSKGGVAANNTSEGRGCRNLSQREGAADDEGESDDEGAADDSETDEESTTEEDDEDNAAESRVNSADALNDARQRTVPVEDMVPEPAPLRPKRKELDSDTGGFRLVQFPGEDRIYIVRNSWVHPTEPKCKFPPADLCSAKGYKGIEMWDPYKFNEVRNSNRIPPDSWKWQKLRFASSERYLGK